MTTCITILGIITCTLDPGATKLTAAQAAAILAPGQYVHVPRYPVQPPAYLFLPPNAPAPARPAPTRPTPARRLDGSLHSDPPWQISLPYHTTYDGLLLLVQQQNQRDAREQEHHNKHHKEEEERQNTRVIPAPAPHAAGIVVRRR